jgi:sigma-E factor negative regulatory protein RseC
MDEVGVVIELKDRLAIVKVAGGGGCEGCKSSGSCKVAEGGRVIEADNGMGAKPGQHVMVELPAGAFLKASFLVYMVPVLFLFIGAGLGGKYGLMLYPGIKEDFWQAIGGVLFLVISLFLVRLYNTAVNKENTLRPVITKILDEYHDRAV